MSNPLTPLYDYLFHYNPHTKIWAAIPRDKYLDYWNNPDVPGVIKANDFSTAYSLVIKVSRDPDFLATFDSLGEL